MTSIHRIEPRNASNLVAGGDAVLVCAYDDEEKCRKNRLEGALTLDEFRSSEPAPEELIILYCK